MSSHLNLSPRDLSLLRLLSWTPATTAMLFRASVTFPGEPFAYERRLRERVQALAAGGFVRCWPTVSAGGGLMNYCKLTPAGFTCLYGPDAALPPRAFFAEVSPGLAEHTFRLAEVIVEIVRVCHERRIKIEHFMRENELTLAAGNENVQPDCFFRLAFAGRVFSFAFEIDQSTESVESHAASSVHKKLLTYHAYQDLVLSQWYRHGKSWDRPRLRVVFLTRSLERAHHILALAATVNQYPTRRLVYATTQESFVTDAAPLHAPLFLDHRGDWQSLVDPYPSAPYSRAPVRLPRLLESALLVC